MLGKNYMKFLAVSAILLGTSAIAQGQVKDMGTFTPSTIKYTAPAKAPEATHDYDWYAAKTYTWTNANGQTQTASLVDEVTDPYQMYDMLKWVYCNPEIPGIKYSGFTNSAVYYGEQFYYTRSGLIFYSYTKTDPGWGITNSNVTAPNEDGHTLFFIKLKNYSTAPGTRTSSKSDLITYFRDNIQSIQLLTNGLRAGEGDNAGTMFNIEGEFNRFFIIGKGKTYYCTPQQDSEGYAGAPYAPFYNMFEEYSPTDYEAPGTINDFYEKMNAGEVYPVLHDCTSVMHFEHYFSMAGKNSTEEKSLTGMIIFIPDNRGVYNERNYDENHQPMVGMYTIDLGATATFVGDKQYRVDLDWSSSLSEVAQSEVPQTYTLYIYDENGNRVEIVTTTDTHYEYIVPQGEHSQSYTYVVHGQATANDAFDTWSNDASVIIPGENDFISLTFGHHESDYVKSEQANYYRNFLGIINDVNAITPANIDAGMNTILVNRFDAAAPGAYTTVATITFTNNNGNVRYAIEYVGQNILSGYELNALEIPVSGNLGNYGANDIVNLSSIQIVDQFAESVADGEYPEEYGYVLVLGDKSSNDVPVRIMKIDATINGFYTQEQVDADNDINNFLPTNVKTAEMQMELVNNQRVYYYTLDRGNDVEIPNEQISYLQRRQDGTFLDMLTGIEHSEGTFTFIDDPEQYGNTGHFMTYLPVVWTFGTGRVKGGNNSYGSPILKTGVGNITLSVTGTKSKHSEYYNWLDGDGNECAIYNPLISFSGNVPGDASVEYTPYMYRVWRVSNDIRCYVYDVNTHKPVNWDIPEGEFDKLIYEEYTNSDQVSIGGHDEYKFGALLYNAEIKFRVRFYYVKYERATGKRSYYVVERTAPWEDISTSIAEFTSNCEVSKTYYNAQGIQSDKPFDGVNIVVTRYNDGTTKTSKVVR